MITFEEISRVSTKEQLTHLVVEKDYALSWLLWGISQHPKTQKQWVFKGGTCLKKCYFKNYRFSEDLDFSYLGTEPLDVEILTKILSECTDFIFEEAGFEFQKKSIQFEVFVNPRGTLSIQGGIKYRGPVRPQVGLSNMPRVKIDLTLDEPLILNPVVREVDHNYSDKPNSGIYSLSYSFEEIFAEKIRALMQRLRPRDLYDVIHLYKRKDSQLSPGSIRSVLEKKCVLREIKAPTFKLIENHSNRKSIESEWAQQLNHQVSLLDDFNKYFDELNLVFNWLYS